MFLQYLGENGQISTCSTTDTGFISTKLFFVFKPNFDIFAEIHQKKMLKIHVAIWHRIPTSEFLCVITNHATDAIKAILRTVNMTFRKLKKNNVRNTNKTMNNLSKKCSNCPPWAFTQVCRIRIENKKVLWK